MKKCNQCGFEMPDDLMFCEECGMPCAQTQTPPQQIYAPPPVNQTAPKKKFGEWVKKNKGKIIAAAIALVVIALIVYVLIFSIVIGGRIVSVGYNDRNGLMITYSNVRDISILSKHDYLEFIDLGNNNISDISALRKMTNLRTLFLRNNNINDVSALYGLNNLTYLDLSGNPLTQEQINGLKAALPNCEIKFE